MERKTCKTIVFPVAILCFALFANEKIASASDVTVVKYQLVSSKRVTRNDYEYTYQAVFTSDAAATGITAHVTSTSGSTTVIDGDVALNRVEAGAQTVASDTFTIRHDRRLRFDPNVLVWNVDHQHPSIPVAAQYVVSAEFPMDNTMVLPDVSYVFNFGKKGWRINEMGQISGTGHSTGFYRHYFWSGDLIDVTSDYERSFQLAENSVMLGSSLHNMSEFSFPEDPRIEYLTAGDPPFYLMSGNIVAGKDSTNSRDYVWSWQQGIAMVNDYRFLDYYFPSTTETLGSVDFVSDNVSHSNASADFVIKADLATSSLSYSTCMFGVVDRGSGNRIARCLTNPPGFSHMLPFDLNIDRSGVGFAFTEYDRNGFYNKGVYAGSKAVRWNAAGDVTVLGVLPGDQNSVAMGINDLNQVVGVSFIYRDNLGMRQDHAFVGDDNGIYDLSSRTVDQRGQVSWRILEATSINNSGQIVATANRVAGGPLYTLILNPVGLTAADLAVENVGTATSRIVQDASDAHFGEIEVQFTISAKNNSDNPVDNAVVSSRFVHGRIAPLFESDSWRFLGAAVSSPTISLNGNKLTCNFRTTDDWHANIARFGDPGGMDTFDCPLTNIGARSVSNLNVTYYIRGKYAYPELGPVALNPTVYYHQRSAVSINKPDSDLKNNLVESGPFVTVVQ